MTIEIDDNIAQRLQQHLEKSSFSDLDDLVRFVLEDYLRAQQESGRNTDDQDINDRLKDLGYF